MKHLFILLFCFCKGLMYSQPCQPTIILLAQDSVNDANLIQSNDGNYLAAGSLSTGLANTNDLFIIKMDAQGKFLWSHTPGDSFVVSCPKIIASRDGNYFILYNSHDQANDIKRSCLLKLNNNGQILWKQKIDNSDRCQAEDLFEENNGELVIVGCEFVIQNFIQEPNIAIYRLDSLGRTISKNTFNRDISIKETLYNSKDSTFRDTTYYFPGFGHAYSLKKTMDGNYLVGGFNLRNPNSYPENGVPLLCKLDSSFQVLWFQNYKSYGINKDYPINIIEESNGNIVLGIRDVYQGVDGGVANIVFRLNSNGELIRELHPGSCNNTIFELQLNQNNQFEIAGQHGISKTDTSGKMISRSYYNVDQKYEVNGRNVIVNPGANVYTLIGKKQNKLCLIQYDYFGDDCITYIKGKVYLDLNKNCQYDSGESNVNQFEIPFGYTDCRFITTDSTGNYSIESDYGDNYTFMYTNPRYWQLGCQGKVKNEIHIDYPQQVKDSVNIGLFKIDTCFYLEKYFHVSSSLPCSERKHYYYLGNYGDTSIRNINLIMNLPLLTSDYSSNYFFIQNGNRLDFHFDSLPGHSNLVIKVKDSISCQAKIGDTLCYQTNLSLERACPRSIIAYRDSICRIIRSSFDPNYIEGYIENNKSCFDGKSNPYLLNYTIHFQNTGNSPTSKIIIRDTLAANYDFSSFKYGIASHAYSLEKTNDGILTFTFDSINLPDSTADFNASQGFVTFSINGYYTTGFGKPIQQQASIYFDHNSPVQTPVHVFDKCITTHSNDPVDIADEINIYPNPAKNYFLMDCTSDNYKFSLIDLNGKHLMNDTPVREKLHRVNLTHLNEGTYLIQIVTGKSVLWKKLILIAD